MTDNKKQFDTCLSIDCEGETHYLCKSKECECRCHKSCDTEKANSNLNSKEHGSKSISFPPWRKSRNSEKASEISQGKKLFLVLYEEIAKNEFRPLNKVELTPAIERDFIKWCYDFKDTTESTWERAISKAFQKLKEIVK
jgi:hypothetical protein